MEERLPAGEKTSAFAVVSGKSGNSVNSGLSGGEIKFRPYGEIGNRGNRGNRVDFDFAGISIATLRALAAVLTYGDASAIAFVTKTPIFATKDHLA